MVCFTTDICLSETHQTVYLVSRLLPQQGNSPPPFLINTHLAQQLLIPRETGLAPDTFLSPFFLPPPQDPFITTAQ